MIAPRHLHKPTRLKSTVQLELSCNESQVLRELNLSKVYTDLHPLCFNAKKKKIHLDNVCTDKKVSC